MATVRERVDHYFSEGNLSPHADGRMWAKTLIFLGSFIGLYILLVSNIFGFWGLLPIGALLGVFSALVGLNI